MSCFRMSCIFSLLLSGWMVAARDRVFGLSMYWRGLHNSRLQACTPFPVSVIRSVFGRQVSLFLVGWKITNSTSMLDTQTRWLGQRIAGTGTSHPNP
jgi:hypothetical protein